MRHIDTIFTYDDSEEEKEQEKNRLAGMFEITYRNPKIKIDPNDFILGTSRDFGKAGDIVEVQISTNKFKIDSWPQK